MRAIMLHPSDQIPAITFDSREDRLPEAGELQIRVSAASINPADIAMWRSLGHDEAPVTPGMDIAGTVDAVGPGVDRFAPGDQVIAVINPRRPEGGGQAERVIVDQSWTTAAPAGLGLTEAATVPMNGLTALEGLRLLDLPAGATLGVTGGAGTLASYAIALAKADGLTVIADAASADHEVVLGFGADHVVSRGRFAAETRAIYPDGLDAVLDTAAITHEAVPAIRDRGAIAVVRGWDTEGDPERGITVRAVSVGNAIGNTAWLGQLAERATAGLLPLRVAATYPAERASSAYAHAQTHGISGRVVLTLEPTAIAGDMKR